MINLKHVSIQNRARVRACIRSHAFRGECSRDEESINQETQGKGSTRHVQIVLRTTHNEHRSPLQMIL